MPSKTVRKQKQSKKENSVKDSEIETSITQSAAIPKDNKKVTEDIIDKEINDSKNVDNSNVLKSSKLVEEQVYKAVRALFAFESKKKEENQGNQVLFDNDATNSSNHIMLNVTTKKMPEKMRMKPERIPLKNGLMDPETTEICLITKDPQRTYKDLLEEKQIKVSKVIGVSKLKDKYKPFEAKRQLCGYFDLFMADERVLPLLPSLIGKTFFEKKKIPVPINLQKTSRLNKEFDQIMSSTFIFFNMGCCNTIKIGLLSQSAEQVVDNIMYAIDKIVEKFPQKWDNIQNIQLKTVNSIALPVYCSLPVDAKAIAAVSQKKNKNQKEQESVSKVSKKKRSLDSQEPEHAPVTMSKVLESVKKQVRNSNSVKKTKVTSQVTTNKTANDKLSNPMQKNVKKAKTN